MIISWYNNFIKRLVVYMNKQIIIDKFTKLGFDTNSANIYLSLIENGPQTVLIISRDLGIERSKVYRSVKILTESGLINETHESWGKKIEAADISSLELLIVKKNMELESAKKIVDDLIAPLNSIAKTGQVGFKIKNYYGQEGVRQMLWNHLRAKDNEIIAFSFKNRNDMAGEKFAEKVRRKQVDRKIKLFELENETDQGDYWYTSVDNWDHYYDSKYVHEDIIKIRQYVAVYNDTVSFINWRDGQEVGVEITNENLAIMQRQLFWTIWNLVEPTAKH